MEKSLNESLTDDELIKLVANRIKANKTNPKVEVEDVLLELDKLNIKLAKSEEHRSRFLSIVRNSFHNPLFGMMTLINSIKKDVGYSDDSEKVIDKIDMLNLELQSLNYQINNVVSASEIEASQLEMNLSKFSLKNLFKDIEESLLFLTIKTKSSLILSGDIEEIKQDRDKIQAIFTNLISNAISLNLDNTKAIKINMFQEDYLIVIDIINNGEMQLDRENIFTAFKEREGEHYNRESQGLGIGLTIVKSYLDFIGGELNFSVQNGETRFRIIIDNFENNELFEEEKPLAFDLDFGLDFDEEVFDFDDGKTI